MYDFIYEHIFALCQNRYRMVWCFVKWKIMAENLILSRHKILKKLFLYTLPRSSFDTNKQFISLADFNSIRRVRMRRREKVSNHTYNSGMVYLAFLSSTDWKCCTFIWRRQKLLKMCAIKVERKNLMIIHCCNVEHL